MLAFEHKLNNSILNLMNVMERKLNVHNGKIYFSA